MPNHVSIPQPMQQRFLTFSIGKQNLALPLGNVQEILPMAELLQPLGMPKLLEGILNLGGIAVPVVRLGLLFNITKQARELFTPLIILKSSMPLALLVEAVHDVIEVDSGSILPIIEMNSFNGCIDGEFIHSEKTFFLVSIQRLFLEQERRTLEEIQIKTQDRLLDLVPFIEAVKIKE